MKKAMKIIKITLLSIIGVLVLTIIIASCVLNGRIRSMMSVKNVGDDLYTMNYKQNYHLDKALKSEIKNEEDLYSFISNNMFFGYQLEIDASKYGCSAFTTSTPDDKKLVGRNFDLSYGSDTLCLYTHHKKSYASISTVSTDMIGVGDGSTYSTKSFMGRAALLASPYLCVDGMNEKGLSVSLLDTDLPYETHLNTGKPDLIVTLAIRLLLDRAATVDEAIELLKQYDIHTSHSWTQHIFVADAKGNSAIVEWHKGEMKIVKYNVCTNFSMSSSLLDGNYSGKCDRFDLLDNALKEKEKNTVEDSMGLLESVKQSKGTYTQWSVVYNLTDFTADYVVNMNYDKVYHLNPKKF